MNYGGSSITVFGTTINEPPLQLPLKRLRYVPTIATTGIFYWKRSPVRSMPFLVLETGREFFPSSRPSVRPFRHSTQLCDPSTSGVKYSGTPLQPFHFVSQRSECYPLQKLSQRMHPGQNAPATVCNIRLGSRIFQSSTVMLLVSWSLWNARTDVTPNAISGEGGDKQFVVVR